MKYQVIRSQTAPRAIAQLCRALGVSRRGYYAWRTRPERRRQREDRQVVMQLRQSHHTSRRTDGSPRVHAELQAHGVRCSKNRVARLMPTQGLHATQRRRFKGTTPSKHSRPVANNLLQRQFAVPQPNRVWTGDITYSWTVEGWLSLATVIDLYSRRIVGWAMRTRLTHDLVSEAPQMARRQRPPAPGVLHHSDRGSQDACLDYQALLAARGFPVRMSRKGNGYDNAPIESFLHTLKTALIHHRRYHTRDDARHDAFEYIEVFYNRQRRQSSLGDLIPAAFEHRARAA